MDARTLLTCILDFISSFTPPPLPVNIPPGFQVAHEIEVHNPGENADKKDVSISLLIIRSQYSEDTIRTRGGKLGGPDGHNRMGNGPTTSRTGR